MDWSPRIAVRGRPRGWHRPMAMGMGYPMGQIIAGLPAITVLAPSTGPVGTACTITGLNFGASQGSSGVTVNGVVASITSWSATSIGITIPVGATTGSVIVTVNSVASNGLTFTVAGATTYHYLVQPGGSDSGSVGPFATISYALQVAANALTGTGKVIGVRAGIYDQEIDPNGAAGTSWTNAIHVVNYQGESVTMRPTSGFAVLRCGGGSGRNEKYLNFDGINLDGHAFNGWTLKFESSAPPYTSSTYDCHHIKVQNATLIGNDGFVPSGNVDQDFTVVAMVASGYAAAIGSHEFTNLVLRRGPAQRTNYRTNGFYLNSPDNTVSYCDIADMLGFGIQLYNGNVGNPDRTIITGNWIHDFPQRQGSWISTVGHNSGIVVAQGSTSKIYNNVIANVDTGEGAKGIWIVSSGTSTQVYNNTLYSNADGGIKMEASTSGTVVRNNISYANGGSGNYLDDTGIATHDHNSWEMPVNGADPQFISPGVNHHLTNPGSPCIGQGTPTSLFTDDKDGQFRTVPWDQGAYETS